MRATGYFARDVYAFWGTTYQFDIKFFDQFLLRQLGNPPFNGVVLCDEDCLTDALARLSETDIHVAQSANSRYLLRGMRIRSGGRFHPKTYLFASRRRTVLLVGSGNLTRSGLDRGNEVFASFDSQEDAGAAVISSWADWIGDLVASREDSQLTARYRALRAALPSLPPTGSETPFWVNDGQPILEVLAAASPAAVKQLHVCAPYYDESGLALAELVDRLQPTDALHIYLGGRTNVDGIALARRLDAKSCRVMVHAYEPAEFVHAKLIGIIGANEEGVLSCGSANLSQAALTRSYGVSGSFANCEAIVVRSGTADQVREAFRPPGLELVEKNLGDLRDLEFESEEDRAQALSIRLLCAERDEEGRIRVRCDSAPEQLLVAWSTVESALPLQGNSVTADPVPEYANPLIVWLVNDAGSPVSNSVVLDDPVKLAETLKESSTAGDRPSELAGGIDETQLVELLTWAHRMFVFDIDETPAAVRASNAQELQSNPEDTDFWERLLRNELQYDPRSQTYRPLPAFDSQSPMDTLLLELQAMLKAAPDEPKRLRLIHSIGHRPEVEGEAETRAGVPWSLSARERVRATNLLRRWCRAVADPRHAWMSPDAPARNYEALIDVLAMIWITDSLEDDGRLISLLGELWTAFVGITERSGFLGRAERPLREDALAALSDDAKGLAAGLAFSSLQDGMPWRSVVYHWQPFLIRGKKLGVIVASEISADLVELLGKERPSIAEVDKLLDDRSAYLDDRTWGSRLAQELKLSRIEILRGFNPNIKLAIRVEGMMNPARDPRLVTIARQAMEKKRSTEVVLVVDDERFRLRMGEVTSARIEGVIRRSPEPMSTTRLEEVESQGGSFADVIGPGLAA